MKYSARFWLAAAVGVFLLVALFVHAERSWQRERARLGVEISAARRVAQEAEARQRERESQLQDALRQIAERKRRVNTPREVVQALPHELPLPAPITLPLGAAGQTGGPQGRAGTSEAPAAGGAAALLPVEDLKPLYDFALDCRACQERLSASQANLADEKQKRIATERELAAVTKLARGGGFWRRFGRAAKWFLLGAAAGAVAASARR